MRVRWVLLTPVLVMALAVLVIGGCGRQQSSTTEANAPVATAEGQATSSTTGPTGKPIKVGCIFSITGPGQPLGEPEKLAAQMVEKQVNSTGGIGGRPLQLIIEDDASAENHAVLAARKLIDKDKVCAIVGPTMSGTTLAIVDICQQAQVPLFSCAASVRITQPVKKWVFSCAQTDVLAVERILPYLKEHKLLRVAILCDSNAFGQSGAAQLRKQLPSVGAQVIDEERFATSATDMTAQLTKIKATNPQAIICWGTNPGPAIVAKDVKSLGIKAQLIMSHGSANQAFIDEAGPAAEGVVLPCGKLLIDGGLPASDPQRAVLQKFTEDFQKAYPGRTVSSFAGYAWDALHMLINAMKTAGDDRAKIRDALESTKGFVGVSGQFNMSPTDHNGLKPDCFTLAVIKNGKWTQTN